MLKVHAAFCLFFFLTGCASISYVEPTDGPTARVRFVTATTGVTVIRGYSDNSCNEGETEWMRLLDGYVVNSSPKSLGLPLADYHVNAFKEFYFPTDRVTHGMFFGNQTIGNTLYECGVPFSYEFIENEDYEVKLNWHIRTCTASVSRFVNESGAWVLVEEVKFNNQVNDENRECLVKFKKTRWY